MIIAKHTELKRSFNAYLASEPADDGAGASAEAVRTGLQWSDLHRKHVSVVLGEAGIGKTVEFQLEAARLNKAAKPAFFVPLNMLRTSDDWELALDQEFEAFRAWEQGHEEGVFFLDAIDEARLVWHADLGRALIAVRKALSACLGRVRIVMSSRLTDWNTTEVVDAVTRHLVVPIAKAAQADGATAFVVTLAPLERREAERCAAHFGLCNPAGFWSAIDTGNVGFMAGHPLDLKRMVALWNASGRLGSYRELLDASIDTQISEVNPIYQKAGKLLSRKRLLEGARRLAAAAEFGGHTYIAVQPSHSAADVLQAQAVLLDWQPAEINSLLSTALFNEAGAERVGFHHRSVREYLAACWVDDEIHGGVPVHRFQALFTAKPFDEPVVVPARRAVLSWLAAINAGARDWVEMHFPELLFHDGDCECWDRGSVDAAFKAYVAAAREQRRVKWQVSATTDVHIARRITPAVVHKNLADSTLPSEVKIRAYAIARAGRLEACAAAVFTNYARQDCALWELTYALDTLKTIGNAAQRAKVLADLDSPKLAGNDAIAAAFEVIDWRSLPAERLTAIFSRTESEAGDFGYGTMHFVLNRMLSSLTLAEVILLLQGILGSCLMHGPRIPSPIDVVRAEDWVRDWHVNALVEYFEQALVLCRAQGCTLAPACVRAAVLLDDLRLAELIDRADAKRLHAAIEALPETRWAIALAIAKSEPLAFATVRLATDDRCLVRLAASDLPALRQRAGDNAFTPAEQAIWFALAVAVASRLRPGRERAEAIKSLRGLPTQDPVLVGRTYLALRSLSQSRWRLAAEAKAAQPAGTGLAPNPQPAHTSAALHARRAEIAAGSDTDGLLRLVNCANPDKRKPDGAAVDCGAVSSAFGPPIEDAFRLGLAAYLGIARLRNPLLYPGLRLPQRPAAVSIAQAAVDVWIAAGVDCSLLSAAQARVAAQIAVWSDAGASAWFARLYDAFPNEVAGALGPWLREDVLAAYRPDAWHAALDLTLAAPIHLRHALLTSILPLLHGAEITEEATLRCLLKALSSDELIAPVNVDAICRAVLLKRANATGCIADLRLVLWWLSTRGLVAWKWFTDYLATLGMQRTVQLDWLAEALYDSPAVWQNWNIAEGGLLLEVCAVVFAPGLADPAQIDSVDERARRRLLLAVLKTLAARPGIQARLALKWLRDKVASAHRARIQTALTDHAEREGAQHAYWRPKQLHAIHRSFDTDPASEAQLHEQVLARLEEIRKSIEEGPFSERVLFSPKTTEKQLQLWLAAKMQDTRNRRFSVHREEEVDADNRTDIQCACPAGNVCVEIKPVNTGRGYSTNSLAKATLSRQIVGQYLKGWNSRHGILVILQLDKKTWDLPGKPERPFAELLTHLQEEADKIKADNDAVDELLVFGIRCI